MRNVVSRISNQNKNQEQMIRLFKSKTFNTQKVQRRIYLSVSFLTLAIILAKPAFSQTKISDNIVWIKSSKNIVKDIAKTEVKKGDTLVVLYAGREDPLLDSINNLRTRYHLLFKNYGVNRKIDPYDLEFFRKNLNLSKMNLLSHSRDTRLAMSYLNEYSNRVKRVIFRGNSKPKIDYNFSNKIPATKKQLVKSAGQGKYEEVNSILESGINPNFGIGETKQSPLLAATIMGHLSVVKLLVENGAKVSETYSNKYVAPPIWYAANNGDIEIVKFLLEHGADPTAKNRDGWTPLRQAKLNNDTKVIELLEDAIKNKN